MLETKPEEEVVVYSSRLEREPNQLFAGSKAIVEYNMRTVVKNRFYQRNEKGVYPVSRGFNIEIRGSGKTIDEAEAQAQNSARRQIEDALYWYYRHRNETFDRT